MTPVTLVDADGNMKVEVIIDSAKEGVIYAHSKHARCRYKLMKRIGAGSFGDVYKATNLNPAEEDGSDRLVAIKLEIRSARRPQLETECRIYKMLQNNEGFSKVYLFTDLKELGYYAMVIEYLGYSLEDLFTFCDRQFSLNTVTRIGDQMLSKIETLHSFHWIHRDIKPDNFVMGNVYMIDFGLAKRYVDIRRKHIPFRNDKDLTGTARYASVNAHRGCEQSRRDDCESLGHVFLYFIRGALPWQGLRANTKREKYDKIAEKKLTTPSEELYKDVPDEFRQYLTYCRALAFDETPDYAMLHKLLTYTPDPEFEFDWIPKMRLFSQRYKAKNNDSGAEV